MMNITAEIAYKNAMRARAENRADLGEAINDEIQYCEEAIEDRMNEGHTYINYTLVTVDENDEEWELDTVKTALSDELRAHGFYTFKGGRPGEMLIKWDEAVQRNNANKS